VRQFCISSPDDFPATFCPLSNNPAQLHRGIGGSGTFFNYVVWESAEHFKQAFNKPQFRSSMTDLLPNAIMSPHLFKKVAVPGICVG
jgi:hypothetical protein